MENKKLITYTTADRLAVLYYLIYNVKSTAYNAVFLNGEKANNKLNYKATLYFNKPNIKALISIMVNELNNKIPVTIERWGLKPSILTIKQKISKSEFNRLDKSEAIRLINETIQQNPGDAKIIKDLAPLLAKLQGWDKQTNKEKSNITYYNLPIR